LPVNFNLYLITDRRQCAGDDLAACIEQALRGGVGAVQLREKDLPTRDRYELALKLRSVTRASGALLLINGDAALARAVGADGLHLPQDGLPANVCRRIVDPHMLIGVSTHTLNEAKDAEARGADFITFGPVFQTPSKAQYGSPVGLEALQTACRTVTVPVFGLGGISAARAETVATAGAAGIGVISAILAAPDREGAAREIARAWRKALARSDETMTKG